MGCMRGVCRVREGKERKGKERSGLGKGGPRPRGKKRGDGSREPDRTAGQPEEGGGDGREGGGGKEGREKVKKNFPHPTQHK